MRKSAIDALFVEAIRVAATAQAAFHTGAPHEILRLPLERGDQAEIVEQHAAAARWRCGGRSSIMPSIGCGQLIEIHVARGAVARASRGDEIHLQPGERLSELVVNLAGDARAFALAHAIYMGGQCAQLLA